MNLKFNKEGKEKIGKEIFEGAYLEPDGFIIFFEKELVYCKVNKQYSKKINDFIKEDVKSEIKGFFKRSTENSLRKYGFWKSFSERFLYMTPSEMKNSEMLNNVIIQNYDTITKCSISEYEEVDMDGGDRLGILNITGDAGKIRIEHKYDKGDPEIELPSKYIKIEKKGFLASIFD